MARSRKRRKKKQTKNIYISFLLIIIILLIGWFWKENKRISQIELSKISLNTYMDIADEISGDGPQINWKPVLAIGAAVTNNRPNEFDENKIYDVTKKFKEESAYSSVKGEGIKLQSLDEVMDKMDLGIKERKLAHIYIEDLEDVSISHWKLSSEKKQFIKNLEKDAKYNYEQFGILPSITIAQAILESSWGESRLATEGNNLFGIKAGNTWQGTSVTMKTKEYQNLIIDGKFRAYENVGDSIKDHGIFLVTNPRYEKNGVFKARNYNRQAEALERAGYSTARNKEGEAIYASLLKSLIKQYSLQSYDYQVQLKDQY